MKRILVAVVLLTLVSAPALAGGAVVVRGPDTGCVVGVLAFFSGTPVIAQIGVEDGVEVQNKVGVPSGHQTCRGTVPFGEDVIADNVPGVGTDIPVTVMTYDEHCAILPLALPGQGCNGSGDGSTTVSGAEIPIPCNSTIDDSEGNPLIRSTQDWKQVISPSGQVTLHCKFK